MDWCMTPFVFVQVCSIGRNPPNEFRQALSFDEEISTVMHRMHTTNRELGSGGGGYLTNLYPSRHNHSSVAFCNKNN